MDAGQELKQSIWVIDNRNFGEKVSEPLVAALFGLTSSRSQSYDRMGNSGRAEIKGSRIVTAPSWSKKPIPLLDRSVSLRRFPKSQCSGNIQHLKLSHFDVLHYVAFFYDKIVVCSISPDEILSHRQSINYSSTQTRDTNPDCDGQFTLKPSNFKFHLDQFARCILTYKQARKYVNIY